MPDRSSTPRRQTSSFQSTWTGKALFGAARFAEFGPQRGEPGADRDVLQTAVERLAIQLVGQHRAQRLASPETSMAYYGD